LLAVTLYLPPSVISVYLPLASLVAESPPAVMVTPGIGLPAGSATVPVSVPAGLFQASTSAIDVDAESSNTIRRPNVSNGWSKRTWKVRSPPARDLMEASYLASWASYTVTQSVVPGAMRWMLYALTR